MKKISKLLVLGVSLATPLLVFAQAGYSGINLGTITPYSEGIKNLINDILVPVLIAIAFIVFLWGAYKYFIWGAENETEKADGRKFAMWGVIGFVIILSLWGIVNLVMGTFGLSVGKAPPYPTIGNTGSTQNTFVGGAPISGTTVGTTPSNSQCAGKAVGASCTVAGRSGTCDYNESNVFDCYATPIDQGITPPSSVLCPDGVTTAANIDECPTP